MKEGPLISPRPVKTNKVFKIVIVGAGFGGLAAAKILCRGQFKVTLIDRNNYHLFQPLLYQVATAGLSPAEITMPIRSIFKKYPLTEVLMAEVEDVNPQKKIVILKDRTIPYDYLILATGVRHGYFGRKDWESFAPGLKTVEDATLMRSKILHAFELSEKEKNPELQKEFLNFVIIGGGPTGVELAGAIAELAHRTLADDFKNINPHSTRVILIEAGARILNSFSTDLSIKAKLALQKLGVDVLENVKVEEVFKNGVTFNGKFFPARTILWAAGVIPTPVVKWLGVASDKNGRATVENNLSLSLYPDIFVIGDVANCVDDRGRSLPGVASVAIQQGKYVGKLLSDKINQRPLSGPFVYHNKGNLAAIGRSFAIGEIGKIKISGFIGWILWSFLHIFYLIGFKNRLLVAVQWIWAYVTFQRGTRIITGAPARPIDYSGELNAAPSN